MIEKCLIEHCAPTLASLKAGERLSGRCYEPGTGCKGREAAGTSQSW